MQRLSIPSLEDMHRGHKRELARRFIAYVENNYVAWMGKMGGNSDLHTLTVQRKILPLLQKDGKCVLIVMGGLRLGQWLYLQKMLEPWFRIEIARLGPRFPPKTFFAVRPCFPASCRATLAWINRNCGGACARAGTRSPAIANC